VGQVVDGKIRNEITERLDELELRISTLGVS
jgi:hypothetical protein